MSTRGAAGKVSRVEAVDLFKFIVLFFMMQGHLFRAYLRPEIRATVWYGYHELLHGLVAPCFLFSAGFASFLSYANKREQYKRVDRAFWRRLRRILFVVWAGYWIHIPALSVKQIWYALAEGRVIDFLRSDVLQCIGIGTLLFTVAAVVLRREWLLLVFSLLAAVCFFFLPPLVQHLPVSFLFRPFFDHELSLFPLFPWAAYIFLGVICAFLYTRLEQRRFFRLLWIAGLLCFPWLFLQKNPYSFKAELTLSGNLTKIGGVFLILALSDLLVRRFRGPLVELLKRTAKESLFVYILHLFILFDSPFCAGLKPYFSDRLGVGGALLFFLVLQAVVFALSLLYNHVKERHPALHRLGFQAFWLLFVMTCILMPV